MHICLLQTKIGKAPERIKPCCPGAILNDSSVFLFEHILNRLVLTWARVEYPSAFLRTKKPCRPPRRIQTFLHFTDENPPAMEAMQYLHLVELESKFSSAKPARSPRPIFCQKVWHAPVGVTSQGT